PGRATAFFDLAGATLWRDVRYTAAFKKGNQRQRGISEAILRRDLWTPLDQIVVKHVGYEDLRGITGASAAAASRAEPFREAVLSILAVCRTSRALAAATAFGPHDVVGGSFIEPTEPRSLVSPCHDGATFFASM